MSDTAKDLSWQYAVAAVLGAVLAFAGYLAVAMAINTWQFEYPLDDVYIHMAMAEQMALDGYGVNAGEYATAASSPLYPFLLMPFAGTEAQRWLPLFWNFLSLIAAAWLIGLALAKAGLGRAGLILAIVAPSALFLINAAYTGMENMAHTAASLAIVIGLWRFAETRSVGWLLPIGVFLAPAFRLEGLALGLAAGGIILILGRPLIGIALGVLAALPLAVMSFSFARLGLDPLPNSVQAKLLAKSADSEGFLSGLTDNILINAATDGGRYVLAMTVVIWLICLVPMGKDSGPRRLVGLAVGASALAHLAVASTGWMDRYENYLVAACFAVLCLLISQAGAVSRWGVLSLALAGSVLTYAPRVDTNIVGMRAIALQQGEMSRFAKEHLAGAVAVNDLGYVAWANPHYVLDLFGLASAEALKLRKSGAPNGWGDALADARDVRAAMIYDDWVGLALGPDWVRLGELVLQNHMNAFLGGDRVAFYARNTAEASRLRPVIEEWAVDLPEDAVFTFDTGGGG